MEESSVVALTQECINIFVELLALFPDKDREHLCDKLMSAIEDSQASSTSTTPPGTRFSHFQQWFTGPHFPISSSGMLHEIVAHLGAVTAVVLRESFKGGFELINVMELLVVLGTEGIWALAGSSSL